MLPLGHPGYERAVRLWDVRTGHQRGAPLLGHEALITFSPDGAFLASSSQDGTVRIWDAATAALVRELRNDEGIYSLDWSPDGERILTGGEHGGVSLWNVGLEHLRQELVQLARHVLTDDEIRRLVPEWPDLWPVITPHTPGASA